MDEGDNADPKISLIIFHLLCRNTLGGKGRTYGVHLRDIDIELGIEGKRKGFSVHGKGAAIDCRRRGETGQLISWMRMIGKRNEA
jgi:hypothetical protein